MKVIIADDHAMIRVGMVQVLEALGDDIAFLEANTFGECIELASKTRDLDLVIIDLLMRDMNWVDGLSALREKLPRVPVVVLSIVEARADILRAIDLGAAGFIPKTASADEILKAVRLVLSGAIYLPRWLLEKGRSETSDRTASAFREEAASSLESPLSALTKRQREVLVLLAEGKRNSEIAGVLGTSEYTIRVHVSAILKSLGVANRTQAALCAKELLSSNRGEAFGEV